MDNRDQQNSIHGLPVAWRFRHVNYVDWSFSKDQPKRTDLEVEPLYNTPQTTEQKHIPTVAQGSPVLPSDIDARSFALARSIQSLDGDYKRMDLGEAAGRIRAFATDVMLAAQPPAAPVETVSAEEIGRYASLCPPPATITGELRGELLGIRAKMGALGAAAWQSAPHSSAETEGQP